MNKDEKQLKLNVEAVLDMYLNGMCDEPDIYTEMSKTECRMYVIGQIYDMKDYGNGRTKYKDGICNNLKFLGNEYINSVIDKYARDNGILKKGE